jgi:hypothetical protein
MTGSVKLCRKLKLLDRIVVRKRQTGGEVTSAQRVSCRRSTAVPSECRAQRQRVNASLLKPDVVPCVMLRRELSIALSRFPDTDELSECFALLGNQGTAVRPLTKYF